MSHPPEGPCAHEPASSADGATLVACAYGGQLLGWTPAGGSGDRLWLSPLARCGDGAAIRGGVPVVFPQFSRRGPLPAHGVARNRPWHLATGRAPDGAAVITARLDDDADTLDVWPHRFSLTLDLTASADRLTTCLTVLNPGDQPFSFSAALHAYLAVGSPAARLRGLGGAHAQDNAAALAPLRLPDGDLDALQPRDLAVPGRSGPVRLVEPGRWLELDRDGFADLVVWNPGPDHGLSDVPPGGASSFVCLEPAQLDPVLLAPGQSWRATATWLAG